MTPSKEYVNELCKGLVDKGLLIQAGWVGLRLSAVHPDAPQNQLDEMRMAFFAGAQHLFASVMGILEPDAEPTETDLRRMSQINAELDTFLQEFKLRTARPGGSA